MTLAHLSPAALFPGLASHNIMVWLGAAATLACLSNIVFDGSRWRSAEVYCMAGLTASVLVSLVVNGLGGSALRGLREFLASAIVFFLVLASVDTVRKLRILALALVLTAICLLSQSLMGWYRNGSASQYVYQQHIYDTQGQVTGEFPRLQSVGFLADPNTFAQFLLVASGLVTLWWPQQPWRRVLVLLGAAFLLCGVLVTHSRGGLFGLAILVFFLLESRLGKIISAVLAGGLLRLLFFLGAAGPRPTSFSRSDPATVGRVEVTQTALDMFRSSPVFGVGFQQFMVHHPALTAHNSLLLCLAELGIFGTLFWLGLIVFSLLGLNRIVRNPGVPPELRVSANAIGIALFTFLATALFLSRTYTMTLYALLGMAAAARQSFLSQTHTAHPIAEVQHA